MRTSIFLILSASALLLAACSGGSNEISQVTALPRMTGTPTPAANEATAADEASPTDEATAADEATPTLRPSATMTSTETVQVSDEVDDNADVSVTATPDAPQPASANNTANNFAYVSPTPSENKLEPGQARSIALATDQFLQPELADEQRVAFDESPVSLRFDEFYSGFSIRTGLQFSDKLKSLDGQQIIMEGYVAPPLKPKLDFFVLTRVQLAFCPFCSSDVEWPDDIALVYLPEQQIISTEFPVRITGRVEVGSSVDAETGMVSLVRIYAENIESIN